MTNPDEFRVVSPVAMLGYGVNAEALDAAMEREPDMIGVDAGSTDAGPYKLGTGRADVSAEMTERDIRLAMRWARKADIPFVIGSAGGSGGAPHVRWTVERVRKVMADLDWHPSVGVIWSDVSPGDIVDAMSQGRLRSLDGIADEVDRLDPGATEIAVAQMGPEPIIAALDEGFQVVIAGRAVDSAIFAAPAIRAGFPAAHALHAGEIIECASLCASPGSAREAAIATIRADGFRIESAHPDRSCTAASVCSHSLYERTNPLLTHGPGYSIDLSASRYTATGDGAVEVTGTTWVQRPLTVKVEGVRCVGHRTFVVAGVRDPIEIATLDESLSRVEHVTREEFADAWDRVTSVRFIQYGKNGVAGSREPDGIDRVVPHEVGIVIDVVADDKDLSEAVCGFLRATLQHFMYPGIKATGANLAFPFSPSDIDFGPVHEFTAYHEMMVDDWRDVFRIESL